MNPTNGPAAVDFIFNGTHSGGGRGVASLLMTNNMDPGCLRPWTDPATGKTYYNNLLTNTDRTFVTNAPATLTREAWLRVDQAVADVSRSELVAWGDLAGTSPYTLTNPLATLSVVHQTMTDISPAAVSMDGMRKSERDRPHFDQASIPIPIIHKDLSFPLREVLASRNGQAPLDVAPVRMATRKVAEMAEAFTLGTPVQGGIPGQPTVAPTITYAGGTVYGYTNFPQRITTTVTPGTTGGWVPETLINEVIAAINLARLKFYRGPFMLYLGTNWFPYLQQDYKAAGATVTPGTSLADRLGRVQNLRGVRVLDNLPGWQFVLVMMTAEVAEGIVGINPTVIQWTSEDGMEIGFKVIAVLVPRLRADANGNTGIIHAT